jgi:hypothetical protein
MGWSQLILVLIEVLGPFLKELLKKWLEKRLNDISVTLPVMASFDDEQAARDLLFASTIRSTLNPFKRVFLRRVQALAQRHNITCTGPRPTLGEADIQELRAYNDTHDEDEG